MGALYDVTLKQLFAFMAVFIGTAGPLLGAVAVPSVFSDHMVLQRNKPLPIWGWADAGEKVRVSFRKYTVSTTANTVGKWRVALPPMDANREPATLTIQGANEIKIDDVLVGDVWVCSGQSNMQWPISASWNADLTRYAADHPRIRLLTVENAGLQKPMQDFEGSWQVCTSETVNQFSAVGYFFGLRLHQILDIPIGLIDNSWGGSACEAWISRFQLEAENDLFEPILRHWDDLAELPENKEPYDDFEAKLLQWEQELIVAKQFGKKHPVPPKILNNRMAKQHRPANLFNGRVLPIVPYAMRGVIWYQGEHNASRAYQYRDLFPKMIQTWRDVWQQGDFPFYWVQLADFFDEVSEPDESDWAELREAQTMTMDRLKNTGQAVIIDLGEAADIHPRNKLEVGNRLARWALARDYGIDLAYRSPQFDTMSVQDGKSTLKFKSVGQGLRTVDANVVEGFSIAGADRQWHSAKARILDNGEIVEVWSPQVPEPMAVRYAWAFNPICNVFSREGLPLTPFRTDDWPGITTNKVLPR